MAGVFDIDLDQPEENVSDDELDDGVSSCPAGLVRSPPATERPALLWDPASIIGHLLIHPVPAELDTTVQTTAAFYFSGCIFSSFGILFK